MCPLRVKATIYLFHIYLKCYESPERQMGCRFDEFGVRFWTALLCFIEFGVGIFFSLFFNLPNHDTNVHSHQTRVEIMKRAHDPWNPSISSFQTSEECHVHQCSNTELDEAQLKKSNATLTVGSTISLAHPFLQFKDLSSILRLNPRLVTSGRIHGLQTQSDPNQL